MKKVLLVPACTDLNRGDQALVWQSVEMIREVYDGEVDCRIIDTGDSLDEIELQSKQTKSKGYLTARNFVPHPGRRSKKQSVHYPIVEKFKMICLALFDFLKLCLILIFPRLAGVAILRGAERATFKFLLECDAVFVKGGGFLHTYGKIQDFYYVWYQTFYMALAIRMGKKVIVFPNSFGPFAAGVSKKYLRFVLRRCALIYAREHISKSVLENELGLKNVSIGPDFGYFMRPSSQDRMVKSIALTVRPYRFPGSEKPSEAYRSYTLNIANYVSEMLARGYQVDFVVQVKGPSVHETDEIAIRDVLNFLPSDLQEKVAIKGLEGDAEDLVAIYSTYEVLVGTRFHSVIFTQVSGGRAIAIGYGGNKSFGIMEMLGLEEYVFDIDGVDSESLLQATFKILSDDSYAHKVSEAMQEFSRMRKDILLECKSYVR